MRVSPHSEDLKNASKYRRRKKYSVLFDTFTLLTSVMIRCSGGGLTSVGNFIINWVATHALAEAIMAFDWSDSTLGEFTEALPETLNPKP